MRVCYCIRHTSFCFVLFFSDGRGRIDRKGARLSSGSSIESSKRLWREMHHTQTYRLGCSIFHCQSLLYRRENPSECCGGGGKVRNAIMAAARDSKFPTLQFDVIWFFFILYFLCSLWIFWHGKRESPSSSHSVASVVFVNKVSIASSPPPQQQSLLCSQQPNPRFFFRWRLKSTRRASRRLRASTPLQKLFEKWREEGLAPIGAPLHAFPKEKKHFEMMTQSNQIVINKTMKSF